MNSPHGYSRYTRGCRCGVCRAAKREYMRARRGEAIVAATQGQSFAVAEMKHGRFGYEECGCRCTTCIEARRTAWRESHRRRAERRRAGAP